MDLYLPQSRTKPPCCHPNEKMQLHNGSTGWCHFMVRPTPNMQNKVIISLNFFSQICVCTCIHQLLIDKMIRKDVLCPFHLHCTRGHSLWSLPFMYKQKVDYVVVCEYYKKRGDDKQVKLNPQCRTAENLGFA